MYDQVLSLLLMKRPKVRRNHPKSEQAFYDRADWDVPASLLRLWLRLGRLRKGG
ncbi:hypothetical protein SAMN05421890_1901 [Ensifer adhaerens]|nr:hypothetical protein SAMN05421890_1901 [Ensifer adhaerens]